MHFSDTGTVSAHFYLILLLLINVYEIKIISFILKLEFVSVLNYFFISGYFLELLLLAGLIHLFGKLINSSKFYMSNIQDIFKYWGDLNFDYDELL